MSDEQLECRSCGAPVTTEREVMRNDKTVGIVLACDDCYEQFMKDLLAFREQYNALLAGGMSSEEANAYMTAKVHGAVADA